ncbi:endonuclease/exonuclease/phosphatase family protein [Sorangium sp. So ce119]|uniref:endonuclease/exonuclease/phosphatase family protein n=1 Tax=Sorangium sp. So ce119 TaxID=3133279 RepID=UPI003F5D62BE
MEGPREGSGAGGSAHGRAGVAARNSLRVLTLNIWNRHDPWEARLGLIRKGVRELAPDIVGLQEVMSYEGRSLADDIAEGLGYEVAFGPAHELGGGVLFGNAVLSRWPVARSQAFPLPTGETDEKRAILLAELASPHGVLPFFVTHLNWKFHHGAVREAQVAAVAEIVLREAPMEGLPPVVVGDFNAQPEATEIRFMKGLHALNQKSVYFADTFDQTGKGPGFTFDPVRNPFAAVTNEYPRRIDYIFVRGPDKQGRGKPLSSRVVFEEIEDGVAASDHYGVLSEISM